MVNCFSTGYRNGDALQPLRTTSEPKLRKDEAPWQKRRQNQGGIVRPMKSTEGTVKRPAPQQRNFRRKQQARRADDAADEGRGRRHDPGARDEVIRDDRARRASEA